MKAIKLPLLNSPIKRNLAIISTLEQELDVEFPLEDLFDLTSVKSIIDEINTLNNTANV